MDGNNRLKEQLVHIDKNLYINPDDPHYHEKMMRYAGSRSARGRASAVRIRGRHREGRGANIVVGGMDASEEPYGFPPGWRMAIVLMLLLNAILLAILLHIGMNRTKQVEGDSILDLGMSSGFREEVSVSTAIETRNFELILRNIPGFKTAAARSFRLDTPTLPLLSRYAANMVRTALVAYIEAKGQPPFRIDELLGDYPANYLSSIPIEPVSGIGAIVDRYDGTGGWVYDPSAGSVEAMFYGNHEGSYSTKTPLSHHESTSIHVLQQEVAAVSGGGIFEPIRIIVSKRDYMLYVVNGADVFVRFPIGLGKDDRTPEGEFRIASRVWEPKGRKGTEFGQAGLAMGDIAIHGTYDETSIGGNKSLGCIRMSNADIAALFPFVPIGTTVTIVDEWAIPSIQTSDYSSTYASSTFDSSQHPINLFTAQPIYNPTNLLTAQTLHDPNNLLAELLPDTMPRTIETSTEIFNWLN